MNARFESGLWGDAGAGVAASASSAPLVAQIDMVFMRGYLCVRRADREGGSGV
jgi:hypothetical protein